MKRVHGFDLLRGLCAFGVAYHHILSWNHIIELNNVSLFFVDLFFVLSGASLFIGYADRLSKQKEVETYFVNRVLRVIPLYATLTISGFFIYNRAHDFEQMAKSFLNATMLFGFGDPGRTNVLTGGWSLGIEFVFYFIFPMFVVLVRSELYLVILVMLFFGQRLYTGLNFDHGTMTDNWVHYTQFLSFAYYFFAGCCVGRLMEKQLISQNRFALPALLVILVCLAFANTGAEEDSLRGFTGTALMAFLPGLVLLAAAVQESRLLSPVYVALGEMSYGLYLIHPLVAYKWNAWIEYPQGRSLAVVAVSMALAWFSNRFFEMPIRNWGRRRWPSMDLRISERASINKIYV